MNPSDKQVPCLLDREIDSAGADAFGHNHFARVLQGLIESPGNRPPFSIGLLGKWGTGKSSIKQLYIVSLKEDQQKDEQGKLRKQRIHSVTFNAWRFGGENVKRALLRHVYIALGGDDEKITDLLFNQLQKPFRIPRSWKEMLRDVYLGFLWPVPQVLIILLIAIFLTRTFAGSFGLSDQQVVTVVLGIFTTAGVFAVKYITSAERLIPRYSNVTRVELPSVSAEQYEDFLTGQIREYKEKYKDCERIVIFVDDLDRLSAEEMVSGLDAIRTFMEISSEGLPAGLGIIFVISCDEDRVATALADRRHKSSGADLPGAVLTRNDARRYLDRIFQFRLEIPPFPKQDMRSFATSRFTEALPGIEEDLKKQGSSVQEVIARMIHVGVQSPRNALLILNAFMQAWWIGTRREREGAGTERVGGLQSGAVTNYPVALAALSALKVDFPGFYEQLLQEPELIGRFTDVFIRKKRLNEQPERAREILTCYTRKAEGAGEPEFDPRHRPLRQYLSSIIGIRWPRSLQPLLLLSQDPVSRRMGDRASAIWDALVSGDAEGILEGLGRASDPKPLTDQDIQVLDGLFEEVENETDDRRNNAGAAVASLTERIPPESSHLLLVPLARRLQDSPELRWRVGVEKISEVARSVPDAEKRGLAGVLVRDLLRPEGGVEFNLEAGESPSLDEAVFMARVAASLALDVLKESGLDQKDEEQLLDWLLVRHVGVETQERELPFGDLEGWMEEHESEILEGLGDRYVEALAAELSSENPSNIDPEAVVHRSRTVFERLWAAGQESRGRLWGLLAAFAELRMTEAARLAWSFSLEHKEAPDLASYSLLVQRMAERLQQTGEGWGLDPREAGEALLRLVDGREADLSKLAQGALADLAIFLSDREEGGYLACGLLDRLIKGGSHEVTRVISDWSDRMLTDLVPQCIDWVASNYESRLNPEQQSSLTTHLDTVYQEELDEEIAERYQRAVRGMPEPAFGSGPMARHLAGLYASISSKYSDDEYIKLVFPAVPRTVATGPQPEAGSMLHQLFSNTRNLPSLHGFLHGEMAGHWPGETEDLSPYDPQQVFTWAGDVVRSNPSEGGALKILASMRNMVEEQLVEDGTEELMACSIALWPYHRQEALKAIDEARTMPTTGETAALMNTISPGSPDEVRDLQTAWSYIAPHFSAEDLSEVTKHILASSVKGTPDQPDIFLWTWLKAAGEASRDMTRDMIRDLVTGDIPNDSQRRRLWLAIEANLTELDHEYVLGIMEAVLRNDAAPETAAAVLESSDKITKLFPNDREKLTLGASLLRSFIDAPNITMKNRLAAWLKELGNEAVLKEVGTSVPATNEDLEILHNHFKRSRHLKKLMLKDQE